MSLIPNTYNGLVSAIKALAEDDSQEFEAFVPTAIFLAEERIEKELDTLGNSFLASSVATPSNSTLSKPSGHRFTHDLYYETSSGNIVYLTKKEDDYLRDYWPNPNQLGQPKYYADRDNTSWTVAPTPTSAYRFHTRYGKQVDHLSPSVSTNYYTDFCPDALYYGTMSHMAEFMKDYSTMEIWEGKFVAAMTGLNNEGRRNRRDDANKPANPTGGTNTLKGDN